MSLKPGLKSLLRSPVGSLVGLPAGPPPPPVPAVAQASITSPADDAVDVGLTPTLTSSAFAVTNEGSDTHASSDWQVAEDAGFAVIAAESLDDATNKTSWTVPGATLENEVEYFARVRHTGATLGDGPWSGVVSFTTAVASAFTLADITVGLWDAAELASQTESDASVPEVGDEVYTAADISTTPVWGNVARVGTGPILRAGGTSYYWNNQNATDDGLGRSYTPAGTAVDVFIVMRATVDAIGTMMSAQGSSSWFIGNWIDSSTDAAFHSNAGSPTITVDGVAPSNQGALYSAILNDWSVVRIANVTPSFSSFSFLGVNSGGDYSITAIIPSSVVATGSNLTDILAELNARVAELNA